MGIAEILGVAASVSLLAGWRLYLTVLATGLAMRFGALPLPEHLQSLQILANPWVMGVAGFGAVMEFFADKVAWLDSAWDAIHGFVRPIGGALLALAVVDAGDPATQAIAGAIALVLLALAAWLLLVARRFLRRLFGRRPAKAPPS